MPVDDEKLSNATDVMGMARGKEGSDERSRTARDPDGASAKVERTPVPVLSATLPTEDAIWSFLKENERRVIDPLPPLLARMFLEVVKRGRQPYQCFGRLKRRQQLQASNLRNSGWPSTSHGLEMAATAPRPKQHGPELLSVTIKYQRGSSAVTSATDKMTIIKVAGSSVTFRPGPIATNTIVSRAHASNPVNPTRA